MKLLGTFITMMIVLGASLNNPVFASEDVFDDHEKLEKDMMYRILEAEDQRRVGDPVLTEALKDSSQRIVVRALEALGRIGDPSSIQLMKPFLDSTRPSVRSAAIFGMGLIGGDEGYQILWEHVSKEKSPGARKTLFLALGRIGKRETVPFFAAELKREIRPEVLSGLAQGLGVLWLQSTVEWETPPGLLKRLIDLTREKEFIALPAAFALARYRGDPAQYPLQELYSALRGTSSRKARCFLIRALGKIKAADVTDRLIERLSLDPWWGARVEAARALGNSQASSAILEALKTALKDPSTQVISEALTSLAKFGGNAETIFADIERLLQVHPSQWIKMTCLETLVAIRKELARERVMEALESTSEMVRLSAVRQLGVYADAADLEKLLQLATSDEVRVAGAAIEAWGKVSEEKIPPELKDILRAALGKGDLVLTSLSADFAASHQWTDFAADLARVYRSMNGADYLETRLAILGALEAIGGPSEVPVLEEALNDPERVVVMAAASAYKKITGVDVSHRIPVASRVEGATPSMAEIERAVGVNVLLETERGPIEIITTRDAPIVSLSFLNLVKKGFYNHLTFHRVVPHFVAQGGDPRGDGYGGPGYLIRDTVTLTSHDRGTIGMATAGKDTAGCQFFFNHDPNLHLDGQYTVFARVVRGLNIMDQLEVGDRIFRAAIKE